MFILSLSDDPLQVEIMMALEEKFDLQLDEEGESMGCCPIPQFDPSYDFSLMQVLRRSQLSRRLPT